MRSPFHPVGLVDLHSHLVPGVDDGSATVAESLEALCHFSRQGVRAVVTTPHLLLPHLPTEAAIGRELDRQRAAFDTLAAAAAAVPELPVVALGQEIWAPDRAALMRLAKRSDVGLSADTLLVEFGFELSGSHVDVVQAALDSGRRIVVAHPERYTYPPEHEPLDLMQEWRELGAMLQVNVGSLTGHYERSSPGAEQLAWRMAEMGLIDLLASDHHGVRRAGVSPAEAWNALMSRGHDALARRAMIETPGSIVADRLPASRLPG